MVSGLEPIAGIRPVAPAGGTILDAGYPLPPGDWRSGVASRSSGCIAGHPWAAICPTAAHIDTGKVNAPAIGEAEVRPFQFYVPWACDWVTPDQYAEMDAEARGNIEAVSAWHLSRELWTGVANDRENDSANRDNPTLMSEAIDIGGVEPANAVFALGALLAEYAGCTQAGGATLHVPIILVPYLTNQGVLKMDGNQLVGPLNTRVSAGPGYPGPGPWGPDGEVAPAGSVWMYVTGPVEYALAEPVLEPDRAERRFDRRRNRYEIWAERRGIVRFNPCCVSAMLVDIPNSTPTAS